MTDTTPVWLADGALRYTVTDSLLAEVQPVGFSRLHCWSVYRCADLKRIAGGDSPTRADAIAAAEAAIEVERCRGWECIP